MRDKFMWHSMENIDRIYANANRIQFHRGKIQILKLHYVKFKHS